MALTTQSYGQAIGSVGPALLQVMIGLETALRYLHPPAIARLREGMAPLVERFETARREFDALEPPEELASLHAQLGLAMEASGSAARLFVEPADPSQAAARMLECMRQHARAQEALYPLRIAFPPFARYFTDESLHERLDELEPERNAELSVGLHASKGEGAEQRGGFALYVPETYDASEDWPLIVALHGGGGCGRDFVWSWLREARSRRCILLAPTASGSTWSFIGPDVDASLLSNMVEYVAQRWSVDRSRILLTGLSDGATYTLYRGLADSLFTALAPLSGVFHPDNETNGNLERARDRSIYLVHGALDWMFPVEIARLARDRLEAAGANVVYREIDNLSHTYAREENDRILDWFLQ